MGNQTAKVSVKNNTKFVDDAEKKSRTNWIAGVSSPPGRPVIELSSRITAPEDDSVTDEINLTWAVPEDDGGYPITGYRVEMLDIQTGKWIEITFIEGYEPKCTLSNILYGIMYRFRAIALNDAGPSEPGEPSEPVVIDVPGVQIAPYFVQMLNDTIALEHEKVEFRVRVLGTPKPSVQWYKDDVEIFACERIEMREEDEGGAVVLKGARLSDSGTIKCVASNILGRCTSTAHFTIEAAPRFEIPENYLEGLIFRHDEVIRLKVPMIAKPVPKVVWFFEDEPISAGSDLTIETTDSYTSLRIQGAKRWHCGEFRVYAENENGEDACSILVTVTSPPSPPGRPVVIDITETRCTLRWEPSEDDGGADVKHYIVEYFRDVWEVWLKAKTTRDTQVTIDDLIPGSRYKFRIKSENVYGISEAGEESDPFDVGSSTSERPNGEGWVSPPPPIQKHPQSPPQIAVDTTSAPPPKTAMAKAKELWGSDEHEEDILDRFLRVKKFTENQMPSYESDGLPSMVGIEEDEPDAVPYSTNADNARRLYLELQQFSNESNHPDLESISDEEPQLSSASNRPKEDLKRARELYAELQQMSSETGGSIENLMESISTSNESVSSIIPLEKRQELSRFEMSLKEMIEEARQMAKTPTGSEEDLRRARDRYYERSPSVQSEAAESVVSVIEKETRPRTPQGMASMMPTPAIAVTHEDGAMKMEQQQRQQQQQLDDRSGRRSPMQQVNDMPGWRRSPLKQPGQVQQPTRRHSASPVRVDEASIPQAVGLGRRRNSEKAGNAEPLVGADRYEEIISARGKRGSSQQLHTGSMTDLFQPGSTMAMREESRQKSSSKTSLRDVPAIIQPISLAGGSRPGSVQALTNSRPGSMTKLNKEITPIEMPPKKSIEIPLKKPIVISAASMAVDKSHFAARQIEPSIDPVKHKPEKSRQVAIDGGTRTAQPFFYLPQNYPDWFVITLAYSAVFISILLISNVSPNGKLYIHFTAFWSMILYFLMDDVDNNSTDVLETVMEGFVKTK